MRININKYLNIIFVCLLLVSSPEFVFAQSTALIGEDLYDPSGTGVVISVNEFSRKPFETGFRSNTKRDEVFVNLTLVNTGSNTYEINPVEDFFFQLDKAYKPETTENRAFLDTFQLFPTMQTRLDLYFIVNAEAKNTPQFYFKFNGSLMKILCDNQASKAVQNNNFELTVQQALDTANVLIDTGKLEEARKTLLIARSKEPENPLVLMLLARVEEKDGEPEMAATYMRAVNPNSFTKVEEAVEAAKMASRLNYPEISVRILSNFESKGLLNPEQKMVLAKAYYHQEKFSMAEYILLPIISSGQADKESHFIMGNIFNRKGDYNRAINQWEMAIDIDPNYAEAMYNIGVAYYKQQKIEKAQEYWRQVLSIQPDAETLRAAEEALKATQYY